MSEITHDEQTLTKVYEGLAAAGVIGEQAIDAVFQMQNRGILFRERKPVVSAGVWTCGHCGRSSQAHAPGMPSADCVHEPVFVPARSRWEPAVGFKRESEAAAEARVILTERGQS